MQYAGLGMPPGTFPGMSAAPTSTSTSSPTPPASGRFGDLSTLGVAASQAASLGGLNQAGAAWWNVLAAQDYMTRLQNAARDPAAYAALLAQQGQMANYEVLAQQAAAAAATAGAKSGASKKSGSSARSSPSGCESPFESLRLPSDTEIIKFTSSSTGPKVPGTTNRGRKKTISLDPGNNSSSGPSSRGSTPTIPAGLTIERKKTGRKSVDSDGGRSSANPVDKVEITKVPIGNGRNSPRGDFLSRLNKIGTDVPSSAATISSIMGQSPSADLFGKKIPSEYYASHALSGAFLAEQIRQQQLAAALESSIKKSGGGSSAQSSSGMDLMQAALMMNSAGASAGGSSETSKLLAIAAAAAAQAAQDTGRSKSNSKKGQKKNTVASMLAASKAGTTGASQKAYNLLAQGLTPEELETAERATANPELTIEPIFKSNSADRYTAQA
jgi:hypothetical protein